MAEEVLDTPVTLPASTTFEQYVAAREPASNDVVAAVIEPDNVVDFTSPDIGQEPETTESAPVEESTTAVAAEPAAPEPATEPVTVEETQEQKEQREKKQGIPQERFNEVTKARREAERDRDAKAVEIERLAKELADLKAKPPEPAKPVAAATEAEPAAPETPSLENFGGDWDAYQVGLKKFNRETYPAYVKQLTTWSQDQRDIAKSKKAEETTAATRKQAEDAAKAKADQAEAEAQTDWKSRVQAVTDAHPDFLEKINATPASAAMVQAIQDLDNGPELAYWLAQRPEEAKRIAEATGFNKELSGPQFRKAIAKAHAEFAKFDISEESQPAAVAAAVAAPAATVVTPAPAVAALPVNPKPNSTKAPRPPSPVQERGAASVKNTSDANTFDEYEAAWKAKQAGKTTRR